MDETEQQISPQDGPPPLEGTPTEARESLPAPWALRDLLRFLAFVPIGFFAADILVSIGYVLLDLAQHGHLTKLKTANDPFFVLVMQTVFYGLVLAYTHHLVTVRHAQAFWPMLRWRRMTVGKTLACLAGGALLTITIALLPPVLPDANQFPLENLFNSRAAIFAIGAFAVLVAPFMEEIIFRGVLFGIFESQIGLRAAILITAILFGGLHVPEYWGAWNHVFMIFLVGLVFSLARGMSGSLAPSVFLHAGYNATMMLGLFLSTEHFRNLHALPHP